MTQPTPEEIAYDLLNRVGVPGWGDEITKAIADAIREAERRGWNAAVRACLLKCDYNRAAFIVSAAIRAL